MPRIGVRIVEDVGLLASLRRAWTEEYRDPVGMLNMLEFRRMPRPGARVGRWGYIANVFVLAKHRNAGIGRQLVDAVIAEARLRGYARVVLAPTDRSVPLYRRAGFAAADDLLVLPL